jgi:membrane protein YqaA with SNARE-associated domain
MRKWLNKLHVWGLNWANTKWGAWALFICAFADASFLPLPTPMFFLALVLLNQTKIYKYALFGTLGSFFGAILGYSIGHFAWLTASGDFTTFAQFLFNHFPGFSETGYFRIHAAFIKWDFWILFVASLIPVPYKLFSISSGVFDMNLFMFCLATLISQAIKFYLLALLIIKIGPEVKKLFEFKFRPITFISTAYVTITMEVKKQFNILHISKNSSIYLFGLTAFLIGGFIIIKFIL